MFNDDVISYIYYINSKLLHELHKYIRYTPLLYKEIGSVIETIS